MCPIFVIKFSGVSDLQGVKVPVFPLTLLVIVTTVPRYRAACDVPHLCSSKNKLLAPPLPGARSVHLALHFSSLPFLFSPLPFRPFPIFSLPSSLLEVGTLLYPSLPFLLPFIPLSKVRANAFVILRNAFWTVVRTSDQKIKNSFRTRSYCDRTKDGHTI